MCVCDMAVCQNQWYHFGVGAPPSLVYFSGDWDVHWGYGLLTHGYMVAVVLELGPLCQMVGTRQKPESRRCSLMLTADLKHGGDCGLVGIDHCWKGTSPY